IAIFFLALIWPAWGPINHPELPSSFGLEVLAYFFAQWVDLGTIIVITSMMVITEISKDSGLFQFIAVKAIRLSKGDPRRLLIIFCMLSFAMCTMLTQITTILIIGSLFFIASDALDISPTPYIISIAIVSNVGGVTTLISSVPSMLIAGAGQLNFIWFLVNMLPLGLILLCVTLIVILHLFREDLSEPSQERVEELMSLEAWDMVPDRGIFYRTAILFVIIIIGFIILGSFGMSFLVALGGAVAFIIFSKLHPGQVLREIEWSALFFFLGLFFMVGLLEEFRILENIGLVLQTVTMGSPIFATITLLWITGLTSGAVDNIPVALTLIPVVNILGTGPTPIPMGALWVALIAGAVLGGNMTPISSAANVLAVTIAEKEKHPISYGKFFKVGIILTIIYMIGCTGYLLIRLIFLPIP
ncbi:MAG: SLC13 family permease, partial [Promethearchaeota archaeon]